MSSFPLAATAEIKTAVEEGKYKPLGILRLDALRRYVALLNSFVWFIRAQPAST